MLKSVSIAVVESALRAGRAELVGNRLGDPIYLSGAFWQSSRDATRYEVIADAVQAAVCADILRRLRAVHVANAGLR